MNVVGIFPDVASVERLVGAILTDKNSEWQTDRRYFSQESRRRLYTPEEPSRLSTPLYMEPIH